MSDSSDVEIVGVINLPNNSVNKVTDDVEFSNSSDDYDDDPHVSGRRAIRQAKSELEKDRRSHLCRLFEFLQNVVLNGQDSGEYWKRAKIVSNALSVCRNLADEENKFKLEMEILMQENWRLKRRIARLSNRKKRKPGCSTLTRKVSSLTLCTPKKENENVSLIKDEFQLKMEIPEEHSVKSLSLKDPHKFTSNDDPLKSCPLNDEVMNDVRKKSEVLSKPLRRRYKKRTGLSEEEQELYVFQEKIEDLLYEVDSFWNEVKDDEEIECEKVDSLSNDCPKDNSNFNSISINFNKEKSPKEKSGESPKSIHDPTISDSRPSNPTINEKPEMISVTDITKLMSPKFVKQHKNIMSNNCNVDSSDDDCPRLVIDEGDSPRNSDQEVNVIEALQAVDNLCRNLVADDVSTFEKEPPSKGKRNSTIIADTIQSDSPVIIID